MNTVILVAMLSGQCAQPNARLDMFTRGGVTAERHSLDHSSSAERTRAFVPPDSQRLQVAVRDVTTVLAIGFLGFLFLIFGAYFFYAPRETKRPIRPTRFESESLRTKQSSETSPKPNPDDFDFEYFYLQIEDDETPRS